MAKKSRKKSPPTKSKANPRTPSLVQDFDPTCWLMDVPCGADSQSIGILAACEDTEIISTALKRSGGTDAILEHLSAIDVRELLGCDERLPNAVMRREDVRQLDEALRQSQSTEYITLLLANGIVHALVVSKHNFEAALRSGELVGHNVLERKQEKYGRGPAARAKLKADRKALMKQYVDSGITDPKGILDGLRRDAPALAGVEIKTIKNMLADL